MGRCAANVQHYFDVTCDPPSRCYGVTGECGKVSLCDTSLMAPGDISRLWRLQIDALGVSM
jgi:hypothetical protein